MAQCVWITGSFCTHHTCKTVARNVNKPSKTLLSVAKLIKIKVLRQFNLCCLFNSSGDTAEFHQLIQQLSKEGGGFLVDMRSQSVFSHETFSFVRGETLSSLFCIHELADARDWLMSLRQGASHADSSASSAFLISLIKRFEFIKIRSLFQIYKYKSMVQVFTMLVSVLLVSQDWFELLFIL